MVMQAAQPALSEIKATGSEQHRLVHVTSALTQLLLLISGVVFLVVLVINKGFVSWWIDPTQFAGHGITLALLVNMLLRHFNTTTVYAIFAFGNERRIAVTTLADGVVTIVAAVILVNIIGPLGAVVGSMAGACLVSLPANLRALARDMRTSLGTVLLPLASWFARFAALVAGAVFVARTWTPESVPALTVAAVLAGTIYVVVMLPVALRPPLGAYLRTRVQTFSNRFVHPRADGAGA